MESKNIIFDFESEFRRYVILNSKAISRIIIFQDTFDNVIFFYCINFDLGLIATKELSMCNFPKYKKEYTELATQLGLQLDPTYHSQNILSIVR